MRHQFKKWAVMGFLISWVSVYAFAAPSLPEVDVILDGAMPHTQGLHLDLPSVADNGASVELNVRFDGSLAESDQLEFIGLFATKNPRVEILHAHFLDARVEPQLTTRIRLNQSQTVIAVARSQQGQFWVAQQDVRVTASGCLMGGDEAQSSRMQQPRIALPRRLHAGRSIDIRTLINHPMETGLNELGAVARTQNLIESFTLELDQQAALQVALFTGVAANPYLRLSLHLPSSSHAEFIWRDQQGETVREQRELRL